MGCVQTNVEERFQRSKLISILDPSFVKGKQQEKELLSIEHVNFKVYEQLEDFQNDLGLRYINGVLATRDNLNDVIRVTKALDVSPYIYVISDEPLHEDYNNLRSVSSLEQISSELTNDLKVIDNLDDENTAEETAQKPTTVSILRRNSKEKDFQLIEKMLTEKNIDFKVFSEFNSMFEGMGSRPPFFIVSEALYTLQLSKIVDKKKTKCFCYAPTADKTFFEMAYYYSNDMADIANEIDNEITEKDLPYTACTRIFVYAPGFDYTNKLEDILLRNQFQVRTVDHLDDLIGSIMSLFAITIFVEQSHVKGVEKKLVEINYIFKTKIIVLKNKDFSDTTLNKEIKEAKKGYKLTKDAAKEIDIVDKNFDSPSFVAMREQLEKSNIVINFYKSAKEYIGRKKYHSEICISSYSDRLKLYDYISNQHLRIKLIIYCAKTKISQDLISDSKFNMVDWNFTRIVKYVKTLRVFYPRVANFTNRAKRMEEVVEKFKNNNRRMSIEKWASTGPTTSEFVILDSKISKVEVAQIQKGAAELWKLEYDPTKCLSRLKGEFIESLRELRKIYKIKIEDIFFSQLAEKIAPMSIWELVSEVNTMFESSNSLILFINASLCRLEETLPLQIIRLKEFMVLMSLNCLSYFQVPLLKKAKLVCWLPKFDDQYALGSLYLNKKYQIFYLEENVGIEESGKYKLEVEITLDRFQDKAFEIHNFVQHKNKFICIPYTKFRFEDKKLVAGDKPYTVIKLAYLKDTEYLQSIYANNVSPLEGLHKVFSNPTLISTIKSSDRLDYKKAQIEEITSLIMFHKGNFAESELHSSNALKTYERLEEVINPEVISELLFQNSLINFNLNRLDKCKKFMMACLRTEPQDVLKEKLAVLKEKLRNQMKGNKMPGLEASMMEPNKGPQNNKGKPLNVFADFNAVASDEQQQNIPQLNAATPRNRKGRSSRYL